MAQSPRTPFHQSAVGWTTLAMLLAVVGVTFLLRSSQPQVAEQLGVGWLLLLLLLIAAVGFVMHLLTRRSLERSVLAPLQRIEEITKAIAGGAVQGRIETARQASSEVVRVAEAINVLAQKATKDIAEMKRLERVRSEFIANVSHELRTPIFSVQGYLETLIDGAVDDPEVSRQFLEKAYHNALRLNALLSDLIDISRIESGELRMSFRYFDIADLLRDVVQTMEIRGTQRNVTVDLDLPLQRELQVFGDKERLIQVMTNLIDNAIKYNREGGTVTVRCARKGTGIQVAVTDTGVGIPADSIGRIFERFYRVDKDRSRAVGGTGLGLAIVKHILEAHGAALTVESTVNVGTTISFELKTSDKQ